MEKHTRPIGITGNEPPGERLSSQFAGVLREQIIHAVDAGGRPNENFWKAKRKQNPALVKSVRKEGVKEGISIGSAIGGYHLYDGHTRLAAARDDQMVPVNWTERSF